MSALTLLALCGIGPEDSWSEAGRPILTVTKGIMAFMEARYGKVYAPNTRETVRRQVLHQFVQWGMVDYNPDQPDRPTNSPQASYAITESALDIIRRFGESGWDIKAELFKHQRAELLEVYQRRQGGNLVPVRLPDGRILHLSPGKHNQVQVAVIEKFAPMFIPGAILLYLGDTARKDFYMDRDRLASLGIPITEHDKLPDIVLYDERHDRLTLIEVVTSHGAMTNTRVLQLKQFLSGCASDKVFVTAFPDFNVFRRYLRNIAWETEVWIAEIPDHLIHYNGDKFLGAH
jgi:type II restriction enzyme